jgi:hypothetical protein
MAVAGVLIAVHLPLQHGAKGLTIMFVDTPERKKQTQLRLHPIVRTQLKKLAARKMTTVTAEITEAIRKHLESEGLWPPSQSSE